MTIEDENKHENRDENENGDEKADGQKDESVIIKKSEPKRVFIEKYDNNSGTGGQAPKTVADKFNWGAFLFNWIWGLKYKRWELLIVLFLCFIPWIGMIAVLAVCIYAGINGNRWAWEVIDYADEKDFHGAQKKWVKAWFIIAGAVILCVGTAMGLHFKKNYKKAPDNLKHPVHSAVITNARKIPKEVYEKTTAEDRYSEFLSSDKYVIYFMKTKNDLNEEIVKGIEEDFAKYNLKDKFVLYSDLAEADEDIEENGENTYTVSCANEGALCIEEWLYKTCRDKYCIINPRTKQYYIVRGEKNIAPEAAKLLQKPGN